MVAGLIIALLVYGAAVIAVIVFLVAILRIRIACTEMNQSLKEIAAAMKAGPRP